jgi:hypothetical protein
LWPQLASNHQNKTRSKKLLSSCQKAIKKLSKSLVVKKLSKSCQKLSNKLPKSFVKIVKKKCQKDAKKKEKKSCKKLKIFKKNSKSFQKVVKNLSQSYQKLVKIFVAPGKYPKKLTVQRSRIGRRRRRLIFDHVPTTSHLVKTRAFYRATLHAQLNKNSKFFNDSCKICG